MRQQSSLSFFLFLLLISFLSSCKPTMMCIPSKEQLIKFDKTLVQEKIDSNSIQISGFFPDSTLLDFPDISQTRISQLTHSTPFQLSPIVDGYFEFQLESEGEYNIVILNNQNDLLGYSERFHVKKGDNWQFIGNSYDVLYYEMVVVKKKLFRKK